MRYRDPYVGQDPRWGPFIAAIEQSGKVILTKDKLAADGQPIERDGYIASYRVANVCRTGTDLTFEFVERLDSFT